MTRTYVKTKIRITPSRQVAKNQTFYGDFASLLLCLPASKSTKGQAGVRVFEMSSTTPAAAARHTVWFAILLAHMFLIRVPLYGQGETTTTRHALGYSLGVTQIKEENLLPKVHSGLTHTLTYELHREGNSGHSATIQLGYGCVSTQIDRDEGSFNARLSLSYSPLFRVRQGGGFAYFLGPRISYSSSLSEYQTWDEAHAYWGTSLSLGVSNVVSLDLGTARDLTFCFDCSLLGITSRPERFRLYANERWTFSNIVGIMNSGYQFGFANDVFQLNTTARYRTPVFSSQFLALSCSLYYSRLNIDGGNPLREIITSIGIGLWL